MQVDATPLVLLFEPDVAARTPLAEYLRGCGYKVVEATTCAEALQVAQSGAPLQAALIDARAPDSFVIAQWLRANSPNTDVVLAGTIDAVVRKAGDLCEAGPGVAKPYDHAAVLDLIKRLRATRDRTS